MIFIFFRLRPNTGPARAMVGMEMMSPYTSVFPISAPSCWLMAVGEGCGGKKPCAVDKAEIIGMPMYNSGKRVAMPVANISGTTITKPAV